MVPSLRNTNRGSASAIARRNAPPDPPANDRAPYEALRAMLSMRHVSPCALSPPRARSIHAFSVRLTRLSPALVDSSQTPFLEANGARLRLSKVSLLEPATVCLESNQSAERLQQSAQSLQDNHENRLQTFHDAVTTKFSRPADGNRHECKDPNLATVRDQASPGAPGTRHSRQA